MYNISNMSKGGSIMNAVEAIKKLEQGNLKYLDAKTGTADISPELRLKTAQKGQKPYAIVICCSDSRVIPEEIFSAGIGDLFVIRVAGNVIDDHQLGSIEYAAEHLGSSLVLVLGHTHCGAVDAAIHHDPSGYIRFITDEIKKAIGEETDPFRACCKNVHRSRELIESSLAIRRDEAEHGLVVAEAVYHIDTGKVEILDAP